MSMNSAPNNPESTEVSKQEVIDVYKKFLDRGITNPDDLDLSDPEVIDANNVYFKWIEQGKHRAEESRQAALEVNFEQATFYFDAGFNDPDYLEDVLDWLYSSDIGKDPGDSAITDLRNKYAQKIKEIRAVLAQNK